MRSEDYCAGKGYHDRSGFMPCSRKGKYREGGKLWCFQHQPAKEKARREEAHRKWKEEWDAKQARSEKRDRIAVAEQRLVGACLKWREETVLIPDRIINYIDAVRKARAS